MRWVFRNIGLGDCLQLVSSLHILKQREGSFSIERQKRFLFLMSYLLGVLKLAQLHRFPDKILLPLFFQVKNPSCIYVVMVWIANCKLVNSIYYAPSDHSVYIRTINSSPIWLLLTFQSSGQLQTADTETPPPPMKRKYLSLSSICADFFFILFFLLKQHKLEMGDLHSCIRERLKGQYITTYQALTEELCTVVERFPAWQCDSHKTCL